MRKWLNKYFSFSKREYNGLLVLIVLVLLIRAIPKVYDYWIPEQDDQRAERAAITQLTLVEETQNELAGHRYPVSTARAAQQMFAFDPNHTTTKEWEMLGLSVRQAAVMTRYLEKGGKFYKKEDLQKMYPISPQMYLKLEPYIQIRDTLRRLKKFAAHPFIPRKGILVSLNRADTLLLDSVSGIGPAFARRIVKYRDRLGGFYRKEQLMEVYGMDSIKYAEVKDQLKLDDFPLRMILINKVEYADLKNHPYLTWKQINAIIQYRKQHGNYSNIADLKKVLILPAETVEKLAPYISFNHD